MHAIRLLAGSLVLISAACGGPGPERADEVEVPEPGRAEPAVVTAEQIVYESRVIERTSEGCGEQQGAVDDRAPGPCAEIRLTWPEISAAPTPEAADRLQGWVLDTLLVAPLGERAEVDSPEAFAEQFFTAFREYRAELPEAPGGWSDERVVEVVYQDPEVVSFRFSELVYTGGAHPNSAVTLASFAPRSGRPLRLDDLFVPDYGEALRDAGERRFREARGLASSESLEEAGFWFEDGFELNDNWAVDDPGLVFHYDPYEIAAYAVGATEVVLTLEDLEGIIDPEGPLAR